MQHHTQAQLVQRNVTEWLLMQRAQDRERWPPLGGIRTVVTLSRQVGAGGHGVGTRLAERLGPGWQFWDRQLLEAIATSAHVRAEMVEAMDEHAQGWMTNVIQTVFKPVALEAAAYRLHLATVVLAVAHQGRKVLLGRGANFLLPEALNVRLRANLPARIAHVVDSKGLTQPQAARFIRENDRARTDFVRNTYGRDIDDPDAYAMVLRTDQLGLEGTVDAIVAALRPRLPPLG